MKITGQKLNQVVGLLNEMDIDLWLTYVRETSTLVDPAFTLTVGLDAVWETFVIVIKSGEKIALVGNFDQENYHRSGMFSEVQTFTKGARNSFLDIIRKYNPNRIAINYSLGDSSADGLTHGMYLKLCEYLKGLDREIPLISSESLLGRLRAIKLPEEISRIQKAAELSLEAWDQVLPSFQIGRSEKQIAKLLDNAIVSLSGENSFTTIVNAGDKTKPGHSLTTDACLEAGDLLHIDFGVKLNGYCSDLQRLVYFPKEDQKKVPEELIQAFETVRDIITRASRLCLQGALGADIDSFARKQLYDRKYSEYQHALGHQLGQMVHDGGALIGPRWERYRNAPDIPLEAGNVFTLELEIILPDIGCVGLEEDIVITESGGEFLCQRQMELIIV